MTRIWEYIKIALKNIQSNKGRSFLTMLGIIIGISSVILIVSTGEGVKEGVSGSLDDLVGGYIGFFAMNDGESGEYVEFTDADLDMIIEKVDHVKGATDFWMFSDATAQSGRCRGAKLASIRQMSGQGSRGSAGEYQADERTGIARTSWRVSVR